MHGMACIQGMPKRVMCRRRDCPRSVRESECHARGDKSHGHITNAKNFEIDEKWWMATLVFSGPGQHRDDFPTRVSGDTLPAAPHSTDSDHRSASRHRPALICVRRSSPFTGCDQGMGRELLAPHRVISRLGPGPFFPIGPHFGPRPARGDVPASRLVLPVQICFTTISNKMVVAPSELSSDGVVAEATIGDPAATAEQASGVSGHIMDAENVTPDKGRQHLPPEGATKHKRSAGDHDRAAMPAEQPAEERPPEEPAPIPQRRALRAAAGPSTSSLMSRGR